MLSIPVKLNRDLIAMFDRVEISRLHTAADPEIGRQTDKRKSLLLTDLCGIIGRAVIDHDIVKTLRVLSDIVYCLLYIPHLIVCRNDRQFFHASLFHPRMLVMYKKLQINRTREVAESADQNAQFHFKF